MLFKRGTRCNMCNRYVYREINVGNFVAVSAY